MRRILVAGMSGTGKSTALGELAKLGFQVIDTDDQPWSEWSETDGGYVWREDLMAELLSRDDGATLFVSGTVSNQGRFYPTFDAVVLLSAAEDVLLSRIRPGRPTHTARRPRNARSSFSSSRRWSRCSGRPAHTSLTPHNRFATS
jgi:broad-specificity NMP kinase